MLDVAQRAPAARWASRRPAGPRPAPGGLAQPTPGATAAPARDRADGLGALMQRAVEIRPLNPGESPNVGQVHFRLAR